MKSNMVWNGSQWEAMSTGGAKYAHEYDYVPIAERMRQQPSDMRLAYRAGNDSVALSHAMDIIRLGAYGYMKTHDYRLAERLRTIIHGRRLK